jgi:hypothetical protein
MWLRFMSCDCRTEKRPCNTPMLLHILLCDEVLPYIALCVEGFHSLNLNLNHRGFEFI